VRAAVSQPIVDNDFGADEHAIRIVLQQPPACVAEAYCVAIDVVHQLVIAPRDWLMRVAEDHVRRRGHADTVVA
jgi:hypothetical protein